jgi:transcriptional regulator with XRE-family HTH domain
MSYELENSDERLATVGGRLRAIRMVRGLTTEQVAERLDVSRATISVWEGNKVKKYPHDKIVKFAKMTAVSVEWLMHRVGDAPTVQQKAINVASPPPFPTLPEEPSIPATPIPAAPAAAPAPAALPASGAEIAEIKPNQPNATELDLTPKATWSIPGEVLTLGFNCDPDHAVITRVIIPVTMPDGMVAHRGDYLLIDTSRITINEPGVYFVADPDGKEVRRLTVSEEENGALIVGDKTGKLDASPEMFTVLGRAMAVFRAL